MEVTKNRDFASGGPDLTTNEIPSKNNNSDIRAEESDASSGVFKEKESTNSQYTPKVTRKNVEIIGNDVEYTRNTNYDEANGSVIVQADVERQRFALWRAQADQDMIKCIKEDDSHHTYFIQPPVNPVTLFFQDSVTEKDYRKKAWQSRDERRSSNGQSGVILVGNNDTHNQSSPQRRSSFGCKSTWSPSGFTAIFDLVVSMFTFVIICLGKINSLLLSNRNWLNNISKTYLASSLGKNTKS